MRLHNNPWKSRSSEHGDSHNVEGTHENMNIIHVEETVFTGSDS